MPDPVTLDGQDTHPRAKRLRLWAALAWMLLIFGTSCTVVMPHEFFAWLDKHLLRDEAASHGFRVFWGFSWFAVVKGWHALEFAVLFLLLQRGLDHLGMTRSRSSAVALLTTIAFAASDEWHQTFVPGRGGTITDVLIDNLGALAAAFVTIRRSSAGRQTLSAGNAEAH